MSLFSDAATGIESTFETTFGVDIKYTQSATEIDISGAIAAAQNYESIDTMGAPIIFESRDYHIPVADFVGLPTTLPKSGDIIKETVNGVAKQYEVFPIGSLSHYTYQDDRQTVFIVHTKLIDD